MRTTPATQKPHERRRDLRLASAAKVNAVVIDGYKNPIDVLRQSELVNVSAGGLALATITPAQPGARVSIQVDDPNPVDPDRERTIFLETLDCATWLDGRKVIRCRLVEGRMPAKFIYNW
jgi:hypothetical protein